MKPQLFIFLGRSGCGKGTQVALLSKYLNEKSPSNGIFYVSTGDEFRKLISGSTFTSRKTKEIVDNGKFAPSFLAVMLWANAMTANYKENMHMIADGSPRKMAEAVAFDTLYSFYEFERVNFIYMNVSKEWAIKRALERAMKEAANARKDDTEQALEKRMGEFENDLKPVIESYRNRKDIHFIEINGEQTIDEVHGEIISSLGLQILNSKSY
jgi:adenylate kinase family enzyme